LRAVEQWICGVDEAGRGPLAGPVFAAAVVLDPDKPIDGLKDSKKLSAKKRDSLYEQILLNARAYSVAVASVHEIDELNILWATMLAMQRAVHGLASSLGRLPDKALIDGNRCPNLDIEMEAIVQGDALVAEISAASILAKVSRDRHMLKLDEIYPQYQFAKHMAYPTALHIQLLNQYGPSPEHRRSFGPVKQLLQSI
jgi:ribonuclease HII